MTVLFAEETSAHWLQRLRLIESPPDTVLQSAELSLRGLFPGWVAIVMVFLGALFAFYLYSTENAKFGILRRVTLALLRTALIGLVILLLLRPVLLAEFHGNRPRGVAVLVDVTQSMTQADRRVTEADRIRLAIAKGLLPPTTTVTDLALLERIPTEKLQDQKRIDIVREVLSNSTLDLLGRFKQIGSVQPFLFDRRLGTTTGDDWYTQLRAEGSQTALADSIQETLVRMGGELPSAMVVITDGRDNASKITLEEVARLCRDKGVPLHIWGVGSAEAGVLQIKDVKSPRTIFIDPKPDVEDDVMEIPIRFRARGFKKGIIVVTAKVGDDIVTEKIPVAEGENLTHTIRLLPRKGKEGPRPVQVKLALEGSKDVGDVVDKVVEVKNSRVKVLYVENRARREYKFVQPALDRDRRVLLRLFLAEGDPRLAEAGPDPESGAMFLEQFPDNFPDPDPKDPDRRPYDLVMLGDVPIKVLGDKGVRSLRKFVKEGGGLVLMAGRDHLPTSYASSGLAEVFPVEFSAQEFNVDDLTRAVPYKPMLTYEGEQSSTIALDDKQEENLKLWKEDLWKNVQGFYWYYPVNNLRPGAVSLLVHPEQKCGKKPDLKPMPIIASQYYGKGEVLYIGTDETWRWRDSTGDRLTSRFWGQIVARFGLPHLLGNSSRSQINIERGEALLNQPGTIKVRVLDDKYEPILRPTIRAQLINLDSRDEATKRREIVLRRITGQPGEYRGALPNDMPGRHEIRIPEGEGLEASTLPYRVELPARHEMEEVGLPVELLRQTAATTGGQLYREEDLHRLPEAIAPQKAPFVQRQELLLWNPLSMVLFVLLITAEWLLRKFSNLS